MCFNQRNCEASIFFIVKESERQANCMAPREFQIALSQVNAHRRIIAVPRRGKKEKEIGRRETSGRERRDRGCNWPVMDFRRKKNTTRRRNGSPIYEKSADCNGNLREQARKKTRSRIDSIGSSESQRNWCWSHANAWIPRAREQKDAWVSDLMQSRVWSSRTTHSHEIIDTKNHELWKQQNPMNSWAQIFINSKPITNQNPINL